MRDRNYAVKRVQRLEVKLDTLLDLPFNSIVNGKPVQKQINSTKAALRRWLKAYPDINNDLLASITRDGK